MPSLAVLATWAVLTLWAIAVGSLVIPLTRRTIGNAGAVRVAMWLGLAMIILALGISNLFVPLRSSTAVAVLAVLTLIALVTTITVLLRLRTRGNPRGLPNRGSIALWPIPVAIALVLAMIAMAHFTFVAVNQWDTGLYHLNAIQYAADYRVIPGLANLHDRLGTTNSHHLLTAFLANSGWGIDAFRLSVGFFAFVFSTEVALRLFRHRKPGSPVGSDRGLIVMLLASLGLWAFLLGNPDEVITSASPDAVALLLMIVAGAYWVDTLTTRRIEWASTALVVAALASAIRVQLWVFAVVAIVVFLLSWRRRPLHHSARGARFVGVLSIAVATGLLVVTQVRDAIQTGWILFPLDRLPLPVDWQAFDPAASREWIVSWARQPGASPGDVNDNWSWLPDWIVRNSAEWSLQLMIGLIGLGVVVAIFLAHGQRSRSLPSGLLIAAAIAPAVAAVGVWFFTAPDPRFAWGPIILLGAIPAALLLGSNALRQSSPLVPVIVTGLVTVAVLPISVSALLGINGELDEGQQVVEFALGPWTIAPALVPVTTPELQPYQLPTGEVLLTPTTDDRCWLAFPNCRPYPNDTLLFRGDNVQDGFASSLTREQAN